MTAPIVDLSHHNRIVDWDALQAAAGGLILKATEGRTWIDPTFKDRANECTRRGIPFGTYHFARPRRHCAPHNDAQKQAWHFDDQTHGWMLELGRWLDWEATADGRNTETLDRLYTRTWLETWGDSVSGGIYANFAQARHLPLDADLWVADWSERRPPDTIGKHHVTMWQYTSRATIPGVEGPVDLSRRYDRAQ